MTYSRNRNGVALLENNQSTIAELQDNKPSLPAPLWHTCGRELVVPMVEIPRSLALDLVRLLSPWTFGADTFREECRADFHEDCANKHKNQMETLEHLVCTELCEQDISPTAENMLRTLAIAYEAAGLVGRDGVR